MGWLLEGNEAVRQQMAQRALALSITGTPDKASHSLGDVTLEDGSTVKAHIVHAVDAIITDGERLAVINRKNDPGKGLPALPGGFLDPTEKGIESAVGAAAREAMEEAGIELEGGVLIGKRNVNRTRDIRIARGEGLAANYGIHDGDIFMVSNQGVRFDVPDLKNTQLVAGDDALPGSARIVGLDTLSREQFGSPDHFDLVAQAIPEKFAGQGRADGQSWAAASGDRSDKSIG